MRGPWYAAYNFENHLKPGFTRETQTKIVRGNTFISQPACEISITSVKFADAPTLIPNTSNPLQDKLDEFETRISNLERGGTGTGTTPQDNTRITTLETKVNALEAMVNTIQQSITNLQNMINDIISGDPVDPTPAPLSGTVFRDANSNGIMDTGELGLADTSIYAIGAEAIHAVTDQNGMYSFDTLTPGTYTVLAFSGDSPSTITITANQPQTHNIAIP